MKLFFAAALVILVAESCTIRVAQPDPLIKISELKHERDSLHSELVMARFGVDAMLGPNVTKDDDGSWVIYQRYIAERRGNTSMSAYFAKPIIDSADKVFRDKSVFWEINVQEAWRTKLKDDAR